MYQIEWQSRGRRPGDLTDVVQVMDALRTARLEFPALRNLNQYTISSALMSADILGFQPDISSLIAHTGIGNSSMYKALERMEKENLIEFYVPPDDRRKKLVRASKKLIDQHVDYLSVARKHIMMLSQISDK